MILTKMKTESNYRYLQNNMYAFVFVGQCKKKKRKNKIRKLGLEIELSKVENY